MRISLAAVPYFWSRDVYLDFYQNVSQSAVDIVYLGETVCSKRRSLKFEDWLQIAAELQTAGKQVVLSTLTMLEAESELKTLTRIASQNEFLVEANDMAAVEVACRNGLRFVGGSTLNIYNNRALKLMIGQGMTRWAVPVELGRDDVIPMIDAAKAAGVEVEYQVFGRLALAYSARCFTARHHHLPKDDCQFKCLDYEQGLKISTQEGDSFAQINGIQTQSAKVYNLLERWKELDHAGIDILRIVPVVAVDTLAVIDQMAAMIHDRDYQDGLPANYEYCNGYWLQIEGMKYQGFTQG